MVNPRHIYGHWQFAQGYDLLQDDGEGLLQLTELGQNFLKQPGGEAESDVDEAEGLLKLLSIVADSGPAKAAGFFDEWGDYLTRCSAVRKDSTIKERMRRRLKNLVARGLIERKRSLYSATPDGLAYLKKTEDEDSMAGGINNEVRELVREHANTVRESLRKLLQDMDPFAFEHLIKRLLEKMGYENAEVTPQSGDGGVDVVADIELGITSVREVIQAKRHSRPIQRKDLDALRGSLPRFKAVRGTIVTTSSFSKPTQEAAFAENGAPITLVDGDKLIDLPIEYEIGVQKRPIYLLEVNADDLREMDADAVAAIEKDN